MASTANKDRDFLKSQWNPALRSLFLAPGENCHIFSCKKKKPSLIRPPSYYGQIFWPIGDRINGVLLYKKNSDSFCRCKFECLSAVYKSEGSSHERSVNMEPKVK